jgi:ATP-dependent DNA ligase
VSALTALPRGAACRRSKDAVETMYKEKGDLGIVALEARKAQPTLFGFKPQPLTLADVRANFLKIAKTSGNKVRLRCWRIDDKAGH